MKTPIILFFSVFVFFGQATAQKTSGLFPKDSSGAVLRGALSPERTCFDLLYYGIDIALDIPAKSIAGHVDMRFKWLGGSEYMQLDLFKNMVLDSVVFADGGKTKRLKYNRIGNAFFVKVPAEISKISNNTFRLYYHGQPQIAKNAPWDGGFVFKKDKTGAPFIAVACQGTGASLWFPCKDHPADEPDNGVQISVTVPDTLMNVSNGRLVGTQTLPNNLKKYTWEVKNPINNYDITLNVGKFLHIKDTFVNESGKTLDLDYYVLPYNEAKARTQFMQVKPMLACFEKYFGSYPFYEDGYKLVETPYLGMEHQSAVAYGNGYKNGYLGFDYWGSGVGLKFDYIIIHESAHEWWGNSITASDQADMWIQESLTTYAEALYVECMYGNASALKYISGYASKIRNDKPIQGLYGLNEEGSGDMYAKGALMWHTLRYAIDDDTKFFGLIKGIATHFYHKTISYTDLLGYINSYTKTDYTWLLNPYIQSTKVPELVLQTKKNTLTYYWANVDKGFKLPVEISYDAGATYTKIFPTTVPNTLMSKRKIGDIKVQEGKTYVKWRAEK